MREKFNLNWPIYDGRHLVRYPSPALRGAQRWRKRVDELERSPGLGGRGREIVVQLLGLPSPITQEAIKAAKRNVARTFHPDGPLAERMMQFLNPAIDELERSL